MKKHIIVSTALLALLVTPALAGGMDKHGDIYMMQQADTNHDGNVTKAEFIAAATKKAEKQFAHMDTSKGDVLDISDYLAHFDAMDSNHDSIISRKEFITFYKKMFKQHRKQGGKDD